MVGTRQLALGVSRSASLKSLNVKANMIGDKGMTLLAASVQSCASLIELDVSMNEIGPEGFQALCEALPFTNLQTLVCCRNMLGDEILELFASIIESEDGQGGTQLRSFDLSSCRLNDQGLIFLINALANSKLVNKIRLADNFFSEQIEAQMLEILNKNMNLVDIGLAGNRLSHSCLAKIKQIYQRNTKLIEEQEPNRLKAELYRLKYEFEQLEDARKELKIKADLIHDLQ